MFLKTLIHIGGYVIGGSKAGVLDVNKISEYENKKFYNLSVAWGCFYDYLEYVKYIAENTDAQKIILHLSSIEVVEYKREELPAVITPSRVDDIKERLNFLFMNPVQIIKDKYINKKQYDLPGGIRNYTAELQQIQDDEEDYIKRAVLSEYDTLLDTIFHKTPILVAKDDNITALRKINEICRAHEIELELVIGPTFITELYKFEGPEYWSYLREIAQTNGFWDFSGFTDANRNPYNFINFQHYNYQFADKILNIIYGKEEPGDLATYVDLTNLEEYIQNRDKKFNEMKQEFEETGTLKLFNKSDPSYIK